MKKYTFLILILSVLLTSCDKELVIMKGTIQDQSIKTLVVKAISSSGNKEKVIDTLEVSEGKFKLRLKSLKPPVKLTFCINDSTSFEAWAGEYGTLTLEVSTDPKIECKASGSFFNDELNRMNRNLYKMYIYPIRMKEMEVAKLEKIEETEKLTEEDSRILMAFRKDIKTAYKLRKKSIVKTARKNKQNPVAISLMCQEYDRLFSHQKKECNKYLSSSFSDTGLNWQMKN